MASRRCGGVAAGMAGAAGLAGLRVSAAVCAATGRGADRRGEGLGLIAVAIIPERSGQLLRQALQARFDHGDAPAAKRYDLAVAFAFSRRGARPFSTTPR